jgi:Tol biopolymer transport system component
MDRSGSQGIFRIDVQSGEVSPVLLDERLSTTLAAPSPDGRKIYFNRRPAALVERDLASGVERVLYRESDPERADIRNGSLSPNGEYFAMPRQIAQTGSILIVPVAGGSPREVIRVVPPEKMFLPTWTPDSGAFLVLKHTGVQWELWIVPIAGGQSRKLDIDPALWESAIATEGDLLLRGNAGFTLSPDGRHLAFVTGENTSEVWALENFLPVPGAKK